MTVAAPEITLDNVWDHMPVDPRRWQAEALPRAVKAVRSRRNCIISATMGAGKSLLLSALCLLATAKRGPRAIVVGAPTQKLVVQLSATLRRCLGKRMVGVYYGRKKQPGAPVIVCCYPSMANLEFDLAQLGRRVSLLICDEVHQTQAEQTREAIEALRPAGAIGFTATPYRSDASERLELWDEVVYQFTLADAWNDGVLVPWKIVNWSSEGRDLLGADLQSLTNEATAEFILEHGKPLGPGIVSAYDIPDAVEHAEFLRSHGIAAEAIHSRLSQGEQRALETALREGDLDCLVHIAMLSEGVDYPWLRWLAARREVKARVRFAQEVGRVLRVDPDNPDKTVGVIFDPHDLFGLHGIVHEPAVGTPEAEDVHLIEPEEPRPESDPDAPRPERRIPPPKDVDRLTQWTHQLLLALEAARIPTDRQADGAWRDRKPTDQQLRGASNLSWATRFFPAKQREPLKQLLRPEVLPTLRRGAVSDLLTVLCAAADASRLSGQGANYTLPNLPSVPPPPDVPALAAWSAS